MKVSAALSKKNILLVDDAISMRHTIKAMLRAQGFENLIEANDGEEALDILQKKDVSLIISDWMMPNMSGLELFDVLKQDDKLKEIPFILLTGNDQKENVTEALKTGIKNYMVKPFKPGKLLEKVVSLLSEEDVSHS